MIFTDRTVIVQKGTSSINDTIVLYRGDREVEIRFTLNESSPFKFGSGVTPNIIEKTEAAYGQLVIKVPGDKAPIFSEITATKKGAITFTITAEMIDEITEVGNYTFQIRLLDENKEGRVTIPEVVNGIEVREPIATEDISNTNEVDIAAVGYALTTAGTTEDTFDSQGNYNKTTWGTGDRITAAKLNKIEAGIDGVNKKVASGGSSGGGTVDLSGYVTKETGNANQITFADGQTFQAKLDAGALKGDKGEQGIQGEKGEQGEQGIQGLKGDKGDKGDTGATGADGQTPNIVIGTVSTLEAGSDATASITGTAPNLTLNLGIPKGASGDGAGGAADSIDWSNVQNKPTIPTKTSELTNDSDFITASTADNRYRKTTTLLTMNDLASDVKSAMTGSSSINPELALNQVERNNLSLDMFKNTYQQLNVVIDDSVTENKVITLKVDVSNIPNDAIVSKYITAHYDISVDGLCMLNIQGYYTYTGQSETTAITKGSIIASDVDKLNIINSATIFGSTKALTIDSMYITITVNYNANYSKKFNIDMHSLCLITGNQYYYPLKIEEVTQDEGLTVTLNSQFGSLPSTDISSILTKNEFINYKLNASKTMERALGTQLENKTWLAFGDSITALSNSYFENGIHKYGMFLDYFKQDTTSSVNKAISGNTSAQQLTVMQDYARTNFDYVSIMIGRNDMSTDIETLRSTFETICDTMISKYAVNGTKIFVILTIPTTGTGTTSLEDIVNMQKEVCYAKNIPCLDLYHQGGFYVQNEVFRTKYITDGTHPNALGYQTFLTYKIMNFMINL